MCVNAGFADLDSRQSFRLERVDFRLAWAVFTNILNGWPQDPQYGLLRALGYVLICPSVSAYLAMNFTRSSTHISFSGVLKAMKFAIPVIIITIFIGSVLILVNSFI